MLYKFDVLVVGGGAAAVRAAVAAADGGARVVMVDKGRFGQSGTSPLGLHGYTSVYHPDDSPDVLAGDLMETGRGVNDLDLVITAARASYGQAESLQGMGVRFVRLPDGNYDIYGGSGHSVPHGINFDERGHGDNFVAVLGAVAREKGITIIENTMIVDLLVDDGTVLGASGIEGRQIHTFAAKAVVLAAGGANRIYPNVAPRIAGDVYRTTGDGYALALRCGLSLVDMEFANFRDTPPLGRLGGTLMNSRGEAVMNKYAPGKEGRAPRGKIVEAIYREMLAGNGPLYIEINAESERMAEFLPAEYKAYVKAYKEGHRPPVTISFQRLLGGVRINPDASTGINGLYAAGENTGGFHGADRLMGAAFLETQVFGTLAGENAAGFARGREHKEISRGLLGALEGTVHRLEENASGPAAGDIAARVRQLTWNGAGIVRQGGELEAALGEIATLRGELARAGGRNWAEVLESANLALTAEAVIRAALARRETRGTHRRSDFPAADPDLDGKHIRVALGPDGQLRVAAVPSRRRPR